MGQVPQSGEVWYANLPFEEDLTQSSERPCVIVLKKGDQFLVIKVTKHERREYDKFDCDIDDWKFAGLKVKSVARVSKVIFIHESQIDNYKGRLSISDEQKIADYLKRFLDSQSE